MSKLARSWLGTLNHPEAQDIREWLEKFYTDSKAVYLNGQLERGENGTPHIQFYLNLKTGQRLSYLTKIEKKAHFTPVVVENGADRYCLKEETRIEGPWEFGIKPVRRNVKHDWEEVKTSAIAGKFEQIPAEILIKHFPNLMKVQAHFSKPEEFEECRGIWIWGPPGCGKTTFAMTEYVDADDIYMKAQNKWWDGYRGQSTVILDDMDSDCLAHYLKRWADKWPGYGETKGAQVALNYKRFIVTSNFSIATIFKDKP